MQGLCIKEVTSPHHFFAIKQTGDLSRRQQRVHLLEKASVQDIGLVKDEADAFAVDTRAAHDASQVLVKVSQGVAAGGLHLQGEREGARGSEEEKRGRKAQEKSAGEKRRKGGENSRRLQSWKTRDLITQNVK